MRRVLVLSLILVLFIGALFLVAAPKAAQYLCTSVSESVKQQGSSLSFERCSLSLTTFSAEKVSFRGLAGRIPLVINIETANVSPAFLSLFGESPYVRFDGGLYGGSYRGGVAVNPETLAGSGDLSLERIGFTRHPMIAATGLQSGTVDLHLRGARWSKGAAPETDFTLNLHNVAKPFATEFRVPSFGPVKIPAFRDLGLEAVGSLSSTQVELRLCNLKSSLGNAAVVGRIPLGRRGAEYSLRGRILLTPEGEGAFGNVLSLLSGAPSGTRQFNFTVKGPPQALDWRVTPHSNTP